MDTLSIVKNKDEEEWSEYCIWRVILEIYDEMARAINTGRPYRTCRKHPGGSALLPPAEGRYSDMNRANIPSFDHYIGIENSRAQTES